MRPCATFLASAAVLAAGFTAHAATYTYSMSGDTASASQYDRNYFATTVIDLMTPAVGGGVAGFTLDLGDTVEGTVQLDSALLVGRGTSGDSLFLALAPIGPALVEYNLTFTLFDGGSQVTLPAGFQVSQGSGGTLSFASFSTDPAPPIAFDRIDFSALVTRIIATSGYEHDIGSVQVFSGAPQLTIERSYLPEPAAWAEMLLGFAGLGARARSRRAGLAAARG